MKKWVKSIQTRGYNGAHTVCKGWTERKTMNFKLKWDAKNTLTPIVVAIWNNRKTTCRIRSSFTFTKFQAFPRLDSSKAQWTIIGYIHNMFWFQMLKWRNCKSVPMFCPKQFLSINEIIGFVEDWVLQLWENVKLKNKNTVTRALTF